MSPCIIWTKAITNNGYPRKKIRGKTIIYTRYLVAKQYNLDYNDRSWEALHSCDLPCCVNIEHLGPGTRSQNTLDSVSRGRHYESTKMACWKGHPYTIENTYINKRTNKRYCRICNREAVDAYNERKNNRSKL